MREQSLKCGLQGGCRVLLPLRRKFQEEPKPLNPKKSQEESKPLRRRERNECIILRPSSKLEPNTKVGFQIYRSNFKRLPTGKFTKMFKIMLPSLWTVIAKSNVDFLCLPSKATDLPRLTDVTGYRVFH